MAMLAQQPAAGSKMGRRTDDDPPHIGKTVGARRQRRLRLEAQIALLQMGITGCDVRRV